MKNQIITIKEKKVLFLVLLILFVSVKSFCLGNYKLFLGVGNFITGDKIGDDLYSQSSYYNKLEYKFQFDLFESLAAGVGFTLFKGPGNSVKLYNYDDFEGKWIPIKIENIYLPNLFLTYRIQIIKNFFLSAEFNLGIGLFEYKGFHVDYYWRKDGEYNLWKTLEEYGPEEYFFETGLSLSIMYKIPKSNLTMGISYSYYKFFGYEPMHHQDSIMGFLLVDIFK